VNHSELKINDIFVRHFNEDLYFKPQNPVDFLNKLLEHMQAKVKGIQSLSQLPIEEVDNLVEIIKAVKNLIQYQSILGNANVHFAPHLSLFCEVMKLRETKGAMKENIRESKSKQIGAFVFEIFRMVAKQPNITVSLIQNIEFKSLIANSFYSQTELISKDDIRKIVGIVETIVLELEGDDKFIEDFLFESHLYLFFLLAILDPSYEEQTQKELIRLLIGISEEMPKAVQYIGSYMPACFFSKIKYIADDLKNLQNAVLEKIKMEQFEWVFTLWNQDVRA